MDIGHSFGFPESEPYRGLSVNFVRGRTLLSSEPTGPVPPQQAWPRHQPPHLPWPRSHPGDATLLSSLWTLGGFSLPNSRNSPVSLSFLPPRRVTSSCLEQDLTCQECWPSSGSGPAWHWPSSTFIAQALSTATCQAPRGHQATKSRQRLMTRLAWADRWTGGQRWQEVTWRELIKGKQMKRQWAFIYASIY